MKASPKKQRSLDLLGKGKKQRYGAGAISISSEAKSFGERVSQTPMWTSTVLLQINQKSMFFVGSCPWIR
jgi:hypothetical protein